MGNDNVDIFKKIIFHIPATRKVLTATLLLGTLYGAVFLAFLKAFAGNLIDPIYFTLSIIPPISLLIFILPSVVSAELLHRILPDYPRNWGYFLATCNQLIIFVYSLIFSGANSLAIAWNIVWMGIITLFLSNFFVLLLTVGYKHISKVGPLSIVQPLIILGSFHILLGRYLLIPLPVYAMNLGILILAGILLLMVFITADYLLAANVSDISALKLAPALFQKKQEKLDLGYPVRPDVQTLEIENSSGKLTLSAPWIHPGPIEGFGGGKITSDIIESLNTDDKGFFLHVPSTHKSDPCDPSDYRKILEAVEEPEKIGEASRLISKDYGDITCHGRKVNGKKIVFMDDSDYDDYELSIFREVIDPEKVLLVDLHNHDIDEKRKEAWYNTETSRKLRRSLEDFLEDLEDLEKHPYKAGFDVDLEDTPVMALVEKTGEQETLLFGVEGNQTSKELRDLRKEFEEEFDKVLLFTTDTHRSIHDLSSRRQAEPSRVIDTIESADQKVSPASIGLTSTKAESMKLLQEDYSGLIFSINILVRLVPLSLVVLYIMLIIWLF